MRQSGIHHSFPVIRLFQGLRFAASRIAWVLPRRGWSPRYLAGHSVWWQNRLLVGDQVPQVWPNRPRNHHANHARVGAGAESETVSDWELYGKLPKLEWTNAEETGSTVEEAYGVLTVLDALS